MQFLFVCRVPVSSQQEVAKYSGRANDKHYQRSGQRHSGSARVRTLIIYIYKKRHMQMLVKYANNLLFFFVIKFYKSEACQERRQ